MKPPQYWRHSKNWKKWLGKRGTIIASTVVQVSSPQRSALGPYSYALVDFGHQKQEFMGVGSQKFIPGDEVECVFRKTAVNEKHDLVEYGIKIKKIH